MRTIVLHGHLRERFGREHRFDVSTPAEALRFMSQHDGFVDQLSEGAYHVVVCPKDRDIDEDGTSLDVDEVVAWNIGEAELHVVPHVEGSKRGGLLKIVLGVALVGAALFFSGGALATPLLGGIGTYGNVAAIGVGLALQGAQSLLTPKAKERETKDDSSFINAGPRTTYEQGGAVPINYGQGVRGAVLISGSSSVERIA